MENYSTIQRNILLIHTRMGMNIKNITLTKRSQTLKNISYIISFTCSSSSEKASHCRRVVGGFQKPGRRCALQSSQSAGSGSPRAAVGVISPGYTHKQTISPP